MVGAPDVTQPAVAPGSTFRYEFAVPTQAARAETQPPIPLSGSGGWPPSENHPHRRLPGAARYRLEPADPHG
ncbi:hypothetical protein [Nocardia brasiliensis]|uniref:hypothetical protein n=1 Tax=Nocardia brasiliensis TaxID=37326 RepID=UPI00351D2AF8